MEVTQTATQIQLKRGGTRKNEKVSYNMQQKQYAKSQGKFGGDNEGRNKQYELDIMYIQNIPKENMPKEWTTKIEEVITRHKSDTRNTPRIKTSVIKLVFEFKQYQQKHDDALEKMLNLL
jgi:hypothetical protein